VLRLRADIAQEGSRKVAPNCDERLTQVRIQEDRVLSRHSRHRSFVWSARHRDETISACGGARAGAKVAGVRQAERREQSVRQGGVEQRRQPCGAGRRTGTKARRRRTFGAAARPTGSGRPSARGDPAALALEELPCPRGFHTFYAGLFAARVAAVEAVCLRAGLPGASAARLRELTLIARHAPPPLEEILSEWATPPSGAAHIGDRASPTAAARQALAGLHGPGRGDR